LHVARPGQEAGSWEWKLILLGSATGLCWLIIRKLSEQFVIGVGHTERPILQVLAALAAAHVLYLAALYVLHREEEVCRTSSAGHVSFRPLGWIVGFGLGFRLLMWASSPIQEIDIYRYIWDGRVTLAGVNPYAYSPQEATHEANIGWQEGRPVFLQPRSADGQRLATLLAEPNVEQVFRIVHHREVATIYPPMSQAVFAAAAWLTPPEWSPGGQAAVFKAVFLLFDIGTLLVLIGILRAVGRPTWWCLAYAWCPLVIKEAANSGHHDVVAVFFCTLSIWLLLRRHRYAALASWGAAVLAKLYPLVLTPLLVRWLWHCSGKSALVGRWRRVGGTAGPLALAAFLIAGTYGLAWPAGPVPALGPLRGLGVFAGEWKMNESLFALVHRSLDALLPDEWQLAVQSQAWWPRAVVRPDGVRPAFVIAQVISWSTVAVIACWFAFRRWPMPASPSTLPEATFYTLAWLFLLSPTANPWYLLWTVPFLPWGRAATWFLLPLTVLHYYFWFWFEYHFPLDPRTEVGGTGLAGREFFARVWLWVEYAPFYALLLAEWLSRRGTKPAGPQPFPRK